jgi:hypothetical protein
MFKKCVIFFFLTIAYSVLLAHNFTPHHHSRKSDHHQHEHNGSTHAHDDNEEKDTEDNSNPFRHFDHIGATEIQYFPAYTREHSIVKQVSPTVFWEQLVVALPQLEITHPDLTHRPREESLILPQSLAYFFSLKAPPAISIA